MRLLLVDQGEYSAKHHIPERLVGLGYRLALVQWHGSVWLRELFDEVIVSRLSHWSYLAETLAAQHRRDPFAGVMSYVEGAVPAADAIARLLGLPRVSGFDAESYRHKDRMRVAWEAAGVPVPRYRVIHGSADARALSTWEFPLVLKPTAMMASKGVIKVDRPADVARLLPGVLATDLEIAWDGELWTLSEAFNLPPVALAEQYVPGNEYSAEGLVVDGAYRLLGVTDKILTDEPYFDEVGHVFPAAGLPAGLVELLGRAHAALGLRNAMTHTEFRIADGGVVFMELNARMAGDHIAGLVDEVLGVDTVDLAARCACGTLDPDQVPTARGAGRRAAAVAFLTVPPGLQGRRLITVDLPELEPGCRRLAAQLYVRPGECIPAPWGGGSVRLGHVIFSAPDPDTARQAVDHLRKGVEIDVQAA